MKGVPELKYVLYELDELNVEETYQKLFDSLKLEYLYFLSKRLLGVKLQGEQIDEDINNKLADVNVRHVIVTPYRVRRLVEILGALNYQIIPSFRRDVPKAILSVIDEGNQTIVMDNDTTRKKRAITTLLSVVHEQYVEADNLLSITFRRKESELTLYLNGYIEIESTNQLDEMSGWIQV